MIRGQETRHAASEKACQDEATFPCSRDGVRQIELYVDMSVLEGAYSLFGLL
jgi:hypothetical protein